MLLKLWTLLFFNECTQLLYAQYEEVKYKGFKTVSDFIEYHYQGLNRNELRRLKTSKFTRVSIEIICDIYVKLPN